MFATCQSHFSIIVSDLNLDIQHLSLNDCNIMKWISLSLYLRIVLIYVVHTSNFLFMRSQTYAPAIFYFHLVTPYLAKLRVLNCQLFINNISISKFLHKISVNLKLFWQDNITNRNSMFSAWLLLELYIHFWQTWSKCVLPKMSFVINLQISGHNLN